MMAKTKWTEIFEVLKERIETEIYASGQNFPTNLELSKEFNAHPMTIQSAVNALIREGLVISSSTRNPRKVRPKLPHKSTRKSFSRDSAGKKYHKNLLELRIITDKEDIPDEVLAEMQAPVLYYCHEQWLEDKLVAVSRSYMPNYINLPELEGRIKEKGSGLYRSMRAMGFKPKYIDETLRATLPTEQDIKDLKLEDNPQSEKVVIMNILRKVFNDDGRLLEYCLLTDRADVYDFNYQFTMD
jgi:GntR family transcriptional regulator